MKGLSLPIYIVEKILVFSEPIYWVSLILMMPPVTTIKAVKSEVRTRMTIPFPFSFSQRKIG